MPDRGEDLPPRGAERAQHPELARALGDRDRERVEDQEGAHEQRHAGEHEQRDPQEAEVAPRCRSSGAWPPGRRSRPAPGAASPSRSGRAAAPASRRRGGHGDLVELPPLVGDPLRLGQQHLGDAGAAEARVAELREPDDPVRLRLVRAGQPQRRPPIFRCPVSAVCVSIEASRVRPRLAALHVGERLEPRRVQRGDEVRARSCGRSGRPSRPRSARTRTPSPSAASTPSTLLHPRRAGAPGTRAAWRPGSPRPGARVIATSVPFSDSLKISPNDLLIVSVRT